MAVDKRELLLDLLARDKTKAATDSAAKNIGGVGDAADDAAKKTDKLSRAAKENADRIGKLDREIGLAENELRSLARAFADTEDASERLDLSRAVRRLENDLRRLNKNKGILEGILPDDPEPEGRSFGKKLVGAIASGGEAAASLAGNKVGLTIGAAAGAAAAPVLLSAIGSAVSAGAGAGVLGAGIMLAVKGDKGIQAAGAQLGKDFVGGLQRSAVSNFSGPIKKSFGVIEDAGVRVTRKWDAAFRELSGSVVPFTKDLVQAGERINDSLTDAAKGSGPALAGLGDSVVLLSDGVGDFIDVLADGGPEAAANLKLIAGATADLFRYTAVGLDGLSKLANNPWITGPLIPLLRKHYDDASASSDKLADSTSELAPEIDKAAEHAKTAAMSYDDMAAAIDKVTDAQRSLYGSEIDVKEAIVETTAKIKENGAGLDLNTDKGRKNRQALLGLADALARDNQAYTSVNGVSEKTTKHMEANRAAFVKAAIAAGYEAGEAKKLADRLLGIPVKTEPRISMKGAAKAIGDTKRLNALVREFQGTYTATMITNYIRHGKPGTGGGLATGGLVHGPGTSTSDSVPMMLSRGEYVVRAAQVARPGVRQMLESLNSGGGYATRSGVSGGAGGWSGRAGSGTAVGAGGSLQVVLSAGSGGDALMRAVIAGLRYEVRTTGGGSVQRLLGVKGVT